MQIALFPFFNHLNESFLHKVLMSESASLLNVGSALHEEHLPIQTSQRLLGKKCEPRWTELARF